jgi:hypothetical protein
MTVFGNILAHAGLSLRLNYASVNTATIDIVAEPTTSWVAKWPTNPPGVTSLMTMAADGTMAFQAIGGGGTVTSVGLALPSIFTVTGSPVTASGTLTAALASQSANAIFAAPDGSAGTPTFRALVANDIPSLLAAKISNFDTQVRTSRLDQMGAPTVAINMNGQKLTGLADPTLAQDAVTKNYADALMTGAIIYRGTANGAAASAAAALTPSNASLRAGDQYKVNAGGSTAFGYQVNIGDFVTYNGATWDKTDNTDPSVTGTSNRITVTPTGDTSYSVDISTNYAGQSTITTVGTIGAGNWQGSAIAVANGGTGAATATGARTTLGAAGVASATFTNTNLVAGILTVNHNLGNQWPDVTIYDNNNKEIHPDDVTATSVTAATVDLTTFGTLSGNWRWTAIG